MGYELISAISLSLPESESCLFMQLVSTGVTKHIVLFKLSLSAWYMHSGIIAHAFKSHEAFLLLETTMGNQSSVRKYPAFLHAHTCTSSLYASDSPVIKFR